MGFFLGFFMESVRVIKLSVYSGMWYSYQFLGSFQRNNGGHITTSVPRNIRLLSCRGVVDVSSSGCLHLRENL